MAADTPDKDASNNIAKAGRLLHSLVPRAQCFCFYDLARNCLWSSDGAEDFEIDGFVAGLPGELISGEQNGGDIFRRTLPSGRTALVLPVYGDSSTSLGVLVSLFSKNAGKSASFNPGLLQNILEPAAELIGEGLSLTQALSSSKQRAAAIEKELELVYSVDEKLHGSRTRHSSLAQLVGQSGRYLGVNYSVLLIPSKRIRISATHSTWKSVNRKALDRYLIETLLPRVEGHRHPVAFDVPPVAGSTDVADQGYQALVCPLVDQGGNVEGMLAQLGRVDDKPFSRNDRRFMSHIVRKVEYVIEQSFDSMTGLMNRAGFEAQLHESWTALTSDSDEHQVIYFDLDNLQLVNDTFGHSAGDELIMRFARMLEEDLPKSGVLSRLTGDDFCLLLTHAGTESALAYANKVRDKAAALRYLEGDRSLQVTISTGIAAFTRASGDDGGVLTTARMACDSAKDHGRDRIEVYDENNQSIIRRYDDMQLVANIQQALDADGFELLAQPIVHLSAKGGGPRYEILLRMKGADGQDLPTKAIFSAAERYQMMPQVDRWVVSRTLSKLGEVAEFIDGQGAIFAVNLSGQSLGDDDILEFIDEEIRQSGIPPTSLCFEITESAAVSRMHKAQAFIDELRERGCSISLDDFGAGLSSFAYLKNFKVDTLKIDGSFIRDITDNRISESMVAAITQVAKVMELETVAEYVETEKTRRLITDLGVDFAQGYVIGKPEPLDAVLENLSDLMNSSAVGG